MTTIHLNEKNFAKEPHLIASNDSFECYTFKYSTGVCGLRLKNSKGFVDVLPFQGQQVWKAVFNGRELTMKSPIAEPVANVDFLKTFGSFVVHCGARRIAGPVGDDVHPLHGDLPSAVYHKAWIISGSDQKGEFFGIGGEYEHTEFFGDHYVACPLLKLYKDSSLFDLSMRITNRNHTPFELMYLCHINFRPVDHGRIVYSTKYTSDYIRLRENIPSHIKVSDEYIAFLKHLQADPSIHHVLKPELKFDPEGVFYIKYLSDKDGYAHTMQVHPDGTADYVTHRPAELPHALRWITRTANHDAIAIIEPATCEADGYIKEKTKGNIKVLQPDQTYGCTMTIGLLDNQETKKIEGFLHENFKQDQY